MSGGSKVATYDYEKVANATVFEWLEEGSPGMVKRAEDAINSFTRLKVREDGIHRKIVSWLPLRNLIRQPLCLLHMPIFQ
jgi:hypothetical protein